VDPLGFAERQQMLAAGHEHADWNCTIERNQACTRSLGRPSLAAAGDWAGLADPQRPTVEPGAVGPGRTRSARQFRLRGRRYTGTVGRGSSRRTPGP
jgi:hypothetical protein